ncbi:type II toxin-antitoxin system RelE/ParE family toxin [Rhodoferax sp. AJA081-3]|uniref:type II toxin-antitoxin system RelE/ParE family toxin n=1 Tax=Rhodoferax sp. AJA081-3 TaxID=2752316 RepID=UPI001ADF1923|nr:type II toxin-antitoxin system RelE/ParE family toxin [Rhodoferax sp. AJA081-3]QTN28089.1 type II toxin-antitoxin system RelE/ParE family toxin [Rhodoferax sp. AJA081-3]
MTLAIVWSAQARRQFLTSLSHIASEDPLAAELVFKRVEKSLHTLGEFSEMGTTSPVSGVRSYPVPKTGHSFDYRVVKGEIRIQRWYRQRQQSLGQL